MRDRARTGVCALVLLATGCQPTTTTSGASPGDGTTALTATATLRLTATRSAAVDTYSADLNEEGTADGRQTRIAASFAVRRRPSTAVSADFTQSGAGGSNGSGEAHAVLVNGLLYLNVPVVSPLLAGGKPWLRVSLTGLEQVTGIDAAGLVGSLLESGPATLSDMFTASTDLSSAGTDQVDGVETTHLRGTVTLRAALQQLDATEREKVRRLYRSDGTISFDLWLDPGHLPRRAAFKVDGDTPTSTTVTFHYGRTVRIIAPPADQTGGLLSAN